MLAHQRTHHTCSPLSSHMSICIQGLLWPSIVKGDIPRFVLHISLSSITTLLLVSFFEPMVEISLVGIKRCENFALEANKGIELSFESSLLFLGRTTSLPPTLFSNTNHTTSSFPGGMKILFSNSQRTTNFSF